MSYASNLQDPRIYAGGTYQGVNGFPMRQGK